MKKYRVLLADDHAIIREGLKKILDDTDDFVVAGQAANGVELMPLVREQDADALILDISMPGRSGLDLIRMIKEERPRLPILVLSMHHEEQYAVRALHAGASGYLTKETEGEVLLSAIRAIAGGGVHVSQKVVELMVRGVRPMAERPPHDLLSDREYQIFTMIVSGMGLTEISTALSLSVKTVSTHKVHILQKTGLTNLADLVRYAIRHRCAEAPDL